MFLFVFCRREPRVPATDDLFLKQKFTTRGKKTTSWQWKAIKQSRYRSKQEFLSFFIYKLPSSNDLRSSQNMLKFNSIVLPEKIDTGKQWTKRKKSIMSFKTDDSELKAMSIDNRRLFTWMEFRFYNFKWLQLPSGAINVNDLLLIRGLILVKIWWMRVDKWCHLIFNISKHLIFSIYLRSLRNISYFTNLISSDLIWYNFQIIWKI